MQRTERANVPDAAEEPPAVTVSLVAPPKPSPVLGATAANLPAAEDWEAAAAALPAPPGEHERGTLLRMALLQRWWLLPDEVVVAEVADRLSLRAFCGLAADARLPTAGELATWRAQVASDPAAAERLRELAERWGGGDTTPLLTIVSPVYRADEIVDELVRRIVTEAERITSRFEVLLVDDGSPDRAWERIAAACAADRRVRGLKLSRNFGQHSAITAGLDHARGEWVVVMDCDLQDDPRYLGELFAKALEGHDIVYAVRARRQHGWLKNLGARGYFTLLRALAPHARSGPMIGTFSILSRRAVDAFRQIGDVHRHYLSVLGWLGFRRAEVVVEHRSRASGRSAYDLRRLLKHAIDGFTSQSNRLLYGALAASLAFLLASLIGAAWVIVAFFVHGFKEGWASTVVLILLATSAVLFAVGIVGLYVGKIFDQVRQRPLYLVQEKRNF
jgi:dolichol-phosphate mannosyltransferase